MKPTNAQISKVLRILNQGWLATETENQHLGTFDTTHLAEIDCVHTLSPDDTPRTLVVIDTYQWNDTSDLGVIHFNHALTLARSCGRKPPPSDGTIYVFLEDEVYFGVPYWGWPNFVAKVYSSIAPPLTLPLDTETPFKTLQDHFIQSLPNQAGANHEL